MTLPDERFYSIKRARQFLIDLLDPQKTPRVPRKIRDEAKSCLRHFPWDYTMERAREKAPEIWGDVKED